MTVCLKFLFSVQLVAEDITSHNRQWMSRQCRTPRVKSWDSIDGIDFIKK